jgi:hypothetical protein
VKLLAEKISSWDNLGHNMNLEKHFLDIAKMEKIKEVSSTP